MRQATPTYLLIVALLLGSAVMSLMILKWMLESVSSGPMSSSAR